MDDPVVEIEDIILKLTTGDPSVQETTIKNYFVPNASFKHPFCTVMASRDSILRIFQWYKILSPHIKIKVNSIAYDEHNLILYVNISQTFAIWFIPFHRSPVTLTTVLQLVRGHSLNSLPYWHCFARRTGKYYIFSQNDLYQVDQFVKFFLPWGIGTLVIGVWHWFATLVCVLGAWIFQPLQPLMREISRPLDPIESPGLSPRSREKMWEDARAVDAVISKQEGRMFSEKGGTVSMAEENGVSEKMIES